MTDDPAVAHLVRKWGIPSDEAERMLRKSGYDLDDE